MKKIIFGLLAGLFLLNGSARAQDGKQYTCASIYAQVFAKKQMNDAKYNDNFNKKRGDYTHNEAMTVVIALAAIANPYIFIAAFTPVAISIIVNAPSKEERVLRLRNESSKQFTRFLERLQNHVSPDITAAEVEAIIENGFKSGLYCENLPNLHSPMDIRKDVRKTLKAKYSHK